MDKIFLAVICSMLYLFFKITYRRSNRLQYYFKWALLYLYTLAVATTLCCVLVWRGRDIRNLQIYMRWLRPMTRFYGMTWHLENAEVLGTCGRAVIISNHQSALDTLGMSHATPAIKDWIATGKKSMLYLGSIGLITYLIGTVFLNRSNHKDAYARLNSAAEFMMKNDVKMWVFPEGTRNKQRKEKVLPFKKGAFVVAVATQSPIIPIVYSPYYFIREDKPIFENGGHIIMRCLEPVPTTGLTMEDVPALTERLHKIVLNAYEELSKEVLYRFPEASKSLQFVTTDGN